MRWAEAAFLIACIFPYTQIIPLGSYNQPYALVLGVLLFASRGANALGELLPVDRWAVAALAVVGIGLFAAGPFPDLEAQDLKYLLNYLTPFLLCPIVASLQSRRPELLEKLLRVSICIWFGVALVQQAFPGFMTFLIGSFAETSEASAASGRGVLGLAPEPTHHGFHMLILGATYAMISPRRWPVILCLMDALLLARSSSAVLALTLGGLAWCILSPKRLVIPAAIGGLVLISGFSLLAASPESSSRLFSLIGLVARNPADLLTVDYSVNMRLGGMISSFSQSIQNSLLPHGLSAHQWAVARIDIIEKTSWLLDLSTVGFPSGFGVLIYQAGWLAVPSILVVIYRLFSTHKLGIRGWLIVSTAFVFLGQYYLATPDFSLLFGVLASAAATRSARNINRDAGSQTELAWAPQWAAPNTGDSGA